MINSIIRYSRVTSSVCGPGFSRSLSAKSGREQNKPAEAGTTNLSEKRRTLDSRDKNEIKYLRLNIRRACWAFNFGIQAEKKRRLQGSEVGVENARNIASGGYCRGELSEPRKSLQCHSPSNPAWSPAPRVFSGASSPASSRLAELASSPMDARPRRLSCARVSPPGSVASWMMPRR